MSIQAVFSPRGGVAFQLVQLINQAKGEITIAAYTITSQKITQALLVALSRKILVQVVMDKSMTHGAQAAIHDQLVKAGAEVRLSHPQGGIMHNKFVIIDHHLLEWGSYNYTNRAEDSNYENATFTDDPNLAGVYYVEYVKIWVSAVQERKRFLSFFRFGRRLRTALKPGVK